MSEPDVNSLARRKRTRGIIPLLAGAIILFLAIAILALVDPFNWQLVDRFRGRYDAAAAAVPAWSAAYGGINLLSSNLIRLDDTLNTIAAATTGTGTDVETLRRQVDEVLAKELGLSLEEDVIPWLGQYVGFAVVTVEVDAFGQPAGFEWVLTAETRDRDSSDQFLEKLARGWSESSGERPVSDSYRGVTVTHFEHLALARSGNMVLFAASANALQQSIDAQGGDSLANTPEYEAAVAELPAERLVTLYVSGEQLNELIASIPTPWPRLSPENLPTASIQGTAVALALVERGLQVDAVTLYDPEQMSTLQRRALETRASASRTTSLFPAETLLFLSGKGVDLFWGGVRGALIAEIGRADFDESMGLFVREFGINPDEALLPYLDGETAVGILPSDQGTIASMIGVGLDVAIAVGTSEESTLASNIDVFSERIGRPQGGLGSVTISETSDLTLYRFETVLVPDLLITYGVGEGYLLLGTSDESLRSLRFDGGSSLAERDEFRGVWEAFPEGSSPGLFVDVQGMFDVIRMSRLLDETTAATIAAAIRPIPYLAAASSAKDNVARNTVIIFVEAAE